MKPYFCTTIFSACRPHQMNTSRNQKKYRIGISRTTGFHLRLSYFICRQPVLSLLYSVAAICSVPNVLTSRTYRFRKAHCTHLSTNNSAKIFLQNWLSLFLHPFSSLHARTSPGEFIISESSSFGRARPCQGRGGRFEPGLPL